MINLLRGAGLAAWAVVLAGWGATAAPRGGVERIDPPHWWAGMHDPSLQLQVYGPGIRGAVPSIDYPGVRIDSVARLDGSPDWQFIYLTLSADVRPGRMKIRWQEGKRRFERVYELRRRDNRRRAQGFDAGDVLYMVMPDRFADANPANNSVASMRFPVGADRANPNVRHGGDLGGIAGHIDYMDSLGITALWLNPVLENDMPGGSYHGYATTDYYRVDPRLGTNAEYAALVDSLHGRGIKVVMDMIFNHSGSEHPWFLNPPSADWFNYGGEYHQTNHKLSAIGDPYASDYDRREATDGWFVREMPDLNQRNPHLMRYLAQNALWWVEEAGIDAIRMDTYPYADARAMGEWVAMMEREYPDFTIVGECWFGESALEAPWQRGSRLAPDGSDTNLPVVMDFPFMIKSRELAPYTSATDNYASGLNVIYNHFALDRIYADPLRLLRFLDNHDTERVLLTAPDSLDAWKQAVAVLLTAPGIPQIYYGTELLMSGDRRPGDGNVRRDVPGGFPGDTVNNFTRAGRSALQNEAYDYLASLLRWRRGNEVIARGTMLHFAPNGGLYLYKRYLRDDPSRHVLVLLNGTDAPLTADMGRYAEAVVPGTVYRDVLTGRTLTPVDASGSPLEMAPREVLILEVAGE